MSTDPNARDTHDVQKHGINAMRQFLTGMARDVPKELRRSAAYRKQLRRGKR